jgi:RNA-binding protein
MTRELSEKQRKYLRGLAHGRDPIVLIGKVRARVGDREQRDLVLDQLASDTGSALVQRIGNVGVFYRASKDKPRIILPGD